MFLPPKKQQAATILSILIIAACIPTLAHSARSDQQLVLSTGYIQQPSNETRSTFLGLSGYPTSTSEIDDIIDVMDANNLNIYRMSANPEWFSSKPHPYRSQYVQYYLDHTPSNWKIIVDRNHIYPPDESGASDFRSHINTARNSILEVCASWPNNPRVIVELGNEYVSNDFHSVFQGLIDDVRDAGYSNPLIVNKWNTGWSTAVFDDPYNNVYSGYHFYFNSWSVSGAMQQMNTALSLGIKIINTEVGASYNEGRDFTSGTVNELQDFLEQCAELGIGNTVWMNENLDNWPYYEDFDFEFPPA
jgi:hypothetical protein